MGSKEMYIQKRKLLKSTELFVMLSRIPSFQHGFVDSHSLLAIANHFLMQYHGIPNRSKDPQLALSCVQESFLDLNKQRKIVNLVQHEELAKENLLAVFPGKWFCPKLFSTNMIDLIEDLDRERLSMSILKPSS
jgi:hypothetical protein